jgi:hypothetical protein
MAITHNVAQVQPDGFSGPNFFACIEQAYERKFGRAEECQSLAFPPSSRNNRGDARRLVIQ